MAAITLQLFIMPSAVPRTKMVFGTDMLHVCMQHLLPGSGHERPGMCRVGAVAVRQAGMRQLASHRMLLRRTCYDKC